MLPPKQDKTKALYDAASQKYNLGTYEEFSTKLQDPAKRKALYDTVGDEFELGTYDQFEKKVVKKKDNTVLPASAGSSASTKSEVKPNSDIVKSNTADVIVPGSVAWAHQQNKKEDPKYSQLYNDYVAASTVSENRKKEIQQQVEDEAAGNGVWNNIKSGGKKAWNFLTDAVTTIGSLGTETTAPDGVRFDSDPLKKEKDEAKKELQQQAAVAKSKKQTVTPITKEDIAARAKQIAIKKRIKSESDSQVRNFLSDAEDKTVGIGDLNEKQYLEQYLYGERATLNEKDKLNLKKQEILKPAIDNTVAGLKDIASRAKQFTDSKQPVPEALQQEYQQKYADYKKLVSDAAGAREEFVNNNENLGSLHDNIDIVKRDYSWGKNFANNIASSTLELDAGALGALDYIGQVMPTLNAYSDNFRRGNKVLREEAQNERDEIIRPMSVDDIKSPNDLGRWLFSTAAQQLPILALTATGAGGIATIGATSTGQKYEEMRDEMDAGTDYNSAQTLGIPLAFGATETASAMVDYYLMKGFGRSIRSANEAERRLIAEGFWKGLKDNAIKTGSSALKAGSLESVDESATQLSQNIIDIYAGGKDNVGVWDNVKDAAAAGAAMGVILPLGGRVISAVTKPFSTDTQIQSTAYEITKLEEQLYNPEISEDTHDIIQEQLNSAEKKLKSLVTKTASKTASLTDEQFNEIIAIEKKQAKLKKSELEISTESTLDEDTKKMLINNLESEFNETNQRRIDILNNETVSSENRDTHTNEVLTDKKTENTDEVVTKNEKEQTNDSPTHGDIRPGTTEGQREDFQPTIDVEPGKTSFDTKRDYRLGTSSKASNYTATFSNGKLDIIDKEGNEPSAPTRRKVEDLYADDFDFTSGNVAPRVEDTNINPNDHVARTSENPSEVAQSLLSLDNDTLINENIDYKTRVIAENIGKVKKKSFVENSDASNIGMSLAKSYFNNEGRSLDTLAQELSDTAGVEITEQDIVDFMLENPNGPQSLFSKIKREARQPLEKRFSELTGLPAKEKYLQKAVEQSLAKDEYLNNYATEIDFLNDEELVSLMNELQQSNETETNIPSTEVVDEAENSGGSEEQPGVQDEGGPENSRSQSEEQPSSGPDDDIDLTEKLRLDKMREWLNSIDDDLTNFGNETLGIHIPVVIAKIAIKAMKGVVNTAATTADVISAGLNAVKKSEWYKNLTISQQQEIDSNFQANFLDQVTDLQDLDDAFEIQENTRFQNLLERTRTKFQDKLLPVRNLQRRVEKFTGRQANVSNNFDAAEVQMHGKASNDLDKFSAKIETIAKKMAALKITQQQVSDYLYAMHAKERNEHIRTIDPSNNEGSGMSDAKADEILNSYSDEEKSKLSDVAGDFYDIISDTRHTYEKYGLESEENRKALEKQFENYVPLKGFAEDELNGDEFNSSGGSSLSVTGRNNRRAAGRTTKADNILSQIIAQHTDAIIRGRKNEVMQKLYNFVEENPNSDLWKIYSEAKPDTRKTNVAGSIRNQPINMEGNDQYVGVKIDGKQYYIKFMNKELGKTINGATVQKSNLILKVLNPLNRFLSSALTSYNPEFVISNFSRDIQTAIYNQLSEQDISENSVKGKKLVKDTIKLVGPSMRTIFRNESGKKPVNEELDKYYEEFKADGAKTGWFYAKGVKDIEKQIQGIIDLQTADTLSAKKAKAGLQAVGGFIENVNTSVENAIRLSTYVSARKAGVDQQDAAVLAKELTVNFNKTGEWGSTVNALYLFFNASIQGSARFAKAMGTLKKTIKDDGTMSYGLNKAQKIAFGMAAFSALVTLANQSLSDDDDDGKSFYSKIPDYVKERNMIFMAPNGRDYYKIPLPYGYNIFSNIGTIASEVSTGERKPGNGVGFLVNSTISAFNPINFSESNSLDKKLTKTATPTVLKPVVDLAVNENFFGSTIYNENFPGVVPKPDSSLGRPNTPAIFNNMAEFMNEATGGDQFVSGGIDVHPESIDYMWRFFVGGAGRFAANTYTTAKTGVDKANGEDVDFETRKIPFVRVVAGEPDPYANQAAYLDRHTEVGQLFQSYKKATPEQRKAEKYRGVPELYRLMKLTDRALKIQRKKKDAYDDMPQGEKRTKGMKKAEENNNDYISRFNKRYNELRKKATDQ